MNLDDAIRLTEILLGLAFIQQSTEHICGSTNNRALFLPRIAFSTLLVFGIYTPYMCAALMIIALLMLHRFQGPYNGGSDRMGHLILCCLGLAHFMPSPQWQEYAFGYLAIQLLLSYFMAGWVKITNPQWRSGQALQDVFRFSAYPVSENLREWAKSPRLMFAASWTVMLFEILLPFTLLSHQTLIIGLTLAAIFHLANAWLFGLNRFFWIWLAAYPSILWLQYRIFDSVNLL